MKERIKRFFKEFWRILKMPEMVILPGQLAFYFVLALVPTVTLISYSASMLNVSSDFLYHFLTSAFSPDVANLLLSTNLSSLNRSTLIIILTVAYFISSNGSNSIILTSNTIYGIKNSNFIQRRIKALVMTLLMLLLLIFLLLVPIFGDSIISLVSYMELNEMLAGRVIWIIQALKSPVSWFIIFLIIKLIYTMAPDRKLESSKVNYGAVFTTIWWVIGTSIYSFYINHIANFNAFYGALANIVILMLWFYYLSFVFTIGMAFNYHKEAEENEKTAALNIVKES